MSWYDPKDARRCWPEGEYDAVVEKAVEHTAKESGNRGRKITLRIYRGEDTMVLSDYLMAGEKAAWKIREFAKGVGQVELFDSGEFDPINFTGANVRVLLKVEDNGDFGEQNKVGKYLPAQPGNAATPTAQAAPATTFTPSRRPSPVTAHKPLGDDDIPF